MEIRQTDTCWAVTDVVEDPTPCSRCGMVIPDEEWPLLVWADDGRMWLYHWACAGLEAPQSPEDD